MRQRALAFFCLLAAVCRSMSVRQRGLTLKFILASSNLFSSRVVQYCAGISTIAAGLLSIILFLFPDEPRGKYLAATEDGRFAVEQGGVIADLYSVGSSVYWAGLRREPFTLRVSNSDCTNQDVNTAIRVYSMSDAAAVEERLQSPRFQRLPPDVRFRTLFPAGRAHPTDRGIVTYLTSQFLDRPRPWTEAEFPLFERVFNYFAGERYVYQDELFSYILLENIAVDGEWFPDKNLGFLLLMGAVCGTQEQIGSEFSVSMIYVHNEWSQF